MFEKFQYWFITDPKAKIKILFFAGSFVAICAMLYGLVLLNSTAGSSTPQPQAQTSSSSQAAQALNFVQGGGISEVDNQSVTADYGVFFDTRDQVLFIDESGNLRYNGSTYTEFDNLFPLSVYPAEKNLIINDVNNVRLFLTESRQIIQLPGNVYSVNPTQENGRLTLYSLQENDQGIELHRGFDPGAIYNSTRLADFQTNKNFYELKRINSSWYIFAYDGFYIKGSVEIYRYDQESESINRIETLNNVYNLVYGQDQIFVNQGVGDGNTVLNIVIDFSENPGGQKYLVNPKQSLETAGIAGQIIPSRCSFSAEVYSLLCLVKIEDVDGLNNTIEDKLVLINYRSNTTRILYNNLLISGKKIFTDKNLNLYIISNSDNKLYKFTDKP
jgi:hypothetical protein